MPSDARYWSPQLVSATTDRPSLMLPLHVSVIGVVLLVVSVVFDRRLYELSSSYGSITLACGVGTLGLIAYARYGLGYRWLSASLVYLALFWMFHFGMAFTALLAPDVLSGMGDWEIAWMRWPNARVGMLLGVLGAAGFVCGAGLTWGPTAAPSDTPPASGTDAMFLVGWATMIVGLAGSALVLALSGGTAIFAMSYLEVRNEVLGEMQTSLDMSQIGCLLAICGAARRQWLAPLAVFSLFAAVLLAVGLRTQAMVSMVMFAIVLSHRGVKFGRGPLIAAVLASLVVVPAIRMIREVGVANRSAVNWTAVSPLDTFVELGGTLRAVAAYVDRVELGDPLLWGATYWAPFDRQVVTRIVPGREQIPFDEDPRLPERNIESEGAIGVSATGEAYANFGAAGPFIYYGVVGLLFGWLERRARSSRYYRAALGVAMSVFFFNIRGSWLAMPAHIAGGLAALFLCYALNQSRQTNVAAPAT